MSGESRQTDSIVETKTSSEGTSSINQLEKTEKKNYCYVCNIQCRRDKDFKQHVSGRKHLNKLNASKKKKPSEKILKVSSKSCSANLKTKDQDTQNCISLAEKTNETMNNSSNRYNQNNRYNSSNFENRYSKNYYPSNYRGGKNFYNNRSYNWNSYSNSPRMPNAPNRPFNYRPQRHQFYSPGGYSLPHSNELSFENNHSFFNPFRSFAESSNSKTFEGNLDYVNRIDCEKGETPENSFSSDVLPPENSFQNFSDDFTSLSKSSKDLTNNEQSDNTNQANADNNTSSHLSDNSTNAPKKHILISRIGNKRVVFRSRSLSSSESDKKRKGKSDIPESEEQRIKEWTDSLLETNHNQITRLINPSNHKEKAAVKCLMTKFSKTKRKENLTRTLRTNSSELTENDVRDLNNQIESTNQDVEDDEISIILDSKNKGSNLELNSAANLCDSPSTSDCKKTSQDQNNKNASKSNKSLKNESAKMHIKKSETVKVGDFISDILSEISSPKCKEKHVKRKSADSDAKVKKKSKTSSSKNININNIESDDSRKFANLKDSVSLPENTKIPNQDSSVAELLGAEVIGKVAADPTSSMNNENKLEENFVFSPDVSVDTLIQLFASGNVKVKEEFNDPIMDALKEISADELINAYSTNHTNVCEEVGNETTTNINRKNSKEKSPSEVSTNKNNNCINPIILGSAAIEDDTSLSATPENNSVKNSTTSGNNSVKNSTTSGNNSVKNSTTSGNNSVKNSTTPGNNSVKNSITPGNTVKNYAVNENVSSPSMVQQTESTLSTASTSDASELHNSPLPYANGANSNNSVLNDLDNSKVELPRYLNKLIKELQDITSEEEKVKECLIEAKSKIAEYASLLEEWKMKKKLLHEQEEILRKQRNSLIKQMQNSVNTDSDDKEKESESSLPKNNTLDDQSPIAKRQKVDNSSAIKEASKVSLTVPSSLSAKQGIQKKNDSLPRSPESDEIIILPSPQKPKPLEITIRDDEENLPVGNQVPWKNMDHHITSGRKSSVYDLKAVNAHSTVINCLVVFEEYLYTCSNDSTAKRFSLKDASLSVIYVHTSKNVTEIVVEKMQNEALVLTSSSNRIISLFIASSGTKIKSFFPPCAVMSICKGWNRFYSGLANGTVNLYNWKYDEIEIVKTAHPASRIATAHQGRLHVLVILSSEGNISIRDAETGLLIRYVKINVKHPSLMCLHCDLVYLSSADKTLSILDIMSGRVEKKLYMNCHTTGLAVFGDYIFNISYSGIINCYNKDNSCNKRIFYGAGKGGLTCVHVYQNWVFTGNRKGDVALFHFDPNSLVPCEFSKCDIVYGLKEDLEYHIEKDHLQKKKLLTLCSWKGCNFKFPRGADIADKMNHIRSHIYPMNCTSASVSC